MSTVTPTGEARRLSRIYSAHPLRYPSVTPTGVARRTRQHILVVYILLIHSVTLFSSPSTPPPQQASFSLAHCLLPASPSRSPLRSTAWACLGSWFALYEFSLPQTRVHLCTLWEDSLQHLHLGTAGVRMLRRVIACLFCLVLVGICLSPTLSTSLRLFAGKHDICTFALSLPFAVRALGPQSVRSAAGEEPRGGVSHREGDGAPRHCGEPRACGTRAGEGECPCLLHLNAAAMPHQSMFLGTQLSTLHLLKLQGRPSQMRC